ncbi:MAG: hypothetical protein LRY27_01640 [Chitinophagales bacterium]|nr:hypothetical protein [Chitinophagales bacterium]
MVLVSHQVVSILLVVFFLRNLIKPYKINIKIRDIGSIIINPIEENIHVGSLNAHFGVPLSL